MTNSHEPMRITDEIPPPSAEDSIQEQDIRVLDSYGLFESEKLTLVGLGKPQAKPEKGQPQSEPPGPWGSHGVDDDEAIPPSLRRTKLGIWGVAIPLFVVLAGVTVIALRGLNPAPRGAAASDVAASVPVVDNAGVFVRVAEKDARVAVDGQERGSAPMLVMGLSPGSHALTITAPGYETFEQPVTLVQNEVSNIEPMLTPLAAKEPELAPIDVADLARAGVTTSESASTRSVPATKSAPVPTAKPFAVVLAESIGAERAEAEKLASAAPSTPAPSLPTSPAESGTLSISSDPPAAVIVDGRPLGKAPRTVDLPAGTHTVVFIHPKEGRRSVTVNVPPGGETTASVQF